MQTRIRVFHALVRLVILSTIPQFCHADCFEQAARYQHVNPLVLRAIAFQESGDNPGAIHRNRNGTTDIGLMQINSIHLRELKRFGIRRRDLMDACVNIYVGSWLLRQKMNRYGNTWRAIGAFHSEAEIGWQDYAALIRQQIRKMQVAGVTYAR